MPDAPMLTVLHGLRLGSVVPADVLARRTGLGPDVVLATLRNCDERGWVRLSEGRLSGWSLTRTGRAEGERLLAEQLDAAGARSTVVAAHRDFVALNQGVLQVCSDWQVLRTDAGEVRNDHSDEGHDLAVLERLGRLHARARPVLRRLAGALDRFAGYEPRLDAALSRTLAGETEWFTRPSLDSYHSVWFELHEDLLATLGRRRDDDRGTGRDDIGAQSVQGRSLTATGSFEESA